MSRRRLLAAASLAAGLVAGLATIAAALGLFETTPTRVVTVPGPPLVLPPRVAADAVVGALRARDAAGLCALLDRRARASAVNDGNGDCLVGARQYADELAGTRVRVGRIVRDGPFAYVHEILNGDESVWLFRLSRGRWLFDHATVVPAA